MNIIALTGKAGAGKDTAAAFLIGMLRRTGQSAERFAFADQLKESAAYALGFPAPSSPNRISAHDPLDWINRLKTDGALTITIPLTDEERELGFPESASISGREYLQYFGTEAHREVFGDSFWVDAAEKVLNEYQSAGVNFAVISDLRFNNEAEFVTDAGGRIINIERPHQNLPHDQHVSESGIDYRFIYYNIINDGTPEQLAEKLAQYLRSPVTK